MKRYIALILIIALAGVGMERLGVPDWWQGVIVGGFLMDAHHRPQTERAVQYDSHGYARYPDVLP